MVAYTTVVKLAEQLSIEEQQALIQHLQTLSRELTVNEKIALFRASILDIPFKEEPPLRRENWYDDDGR